MSADECACGCCAELVPAAPIPVFNAPGLPAIAYRIGTYATFREAMVERIGGTLALSALTTREPSDYALAVLDSWAYVADILTFYSERTVNEAFLRTAKLRDSVVRLAAMVGYDPSPGLAATTALAFTAEAAFTLKAGARVQSTPAPGDTAPPVKFETLADLPLAAALNAVPITGVPGPASPLAAGSFGGSLAPEWFVPPTVVAGATLVAWNAASGAVQRLRCTGTLDDVKAPPAGMVFWTPQLEQDADAISRLVQTVRLFGWDAPEVGISATGVSKDTNGNTVVGLAATTSDYSLASTNTIQLDAIYGEVSAGDQVLVVDSTDDALLLVATVTAATAAKTTFTGPVSGLVTQLTLSASLPAVDIRNVEVLLLADGLSLWDLQLAAVIEAGAQTVCAGLDPSQAPLAGQAIVLGDGTGVPYEATVVACTPSPDLPAVIEIAFSPPLAGALAVASATMQGNIVRGSQGDTVTGELIGTGDASLPGQRFPLAKPPVTFLPHAGAPHGGQTTLVVRVGGVQWTERAWLYGAGPDARVYVVEREDDGRTFVRFGDGVLGARLPSGAPVTADYRTGLGTAGNLAAGLLRLPLTRPKGLRGVVNPLPAAGGADPEPLEVARSNAPNTVRTFERIVSLQDVEDQARANALVAKASARWITVGVAPGVGLTVAGPDGAELLAEQLAELQADLDARRDPNQALRIRGYKPVALTVTVRLIAMQAELRPDDVAAATQAVLLERFAFATRQFGQPVRLSEVLVAAQSATGVLGVDVDGMTLADPAQRAAHLLSSDPVQDRIDLAPDELATLAAADLEVIVA